MNCILVGIHIVMHVYSLATVLVLVVVVSHLDNSHLSKQQLVKALFTFCSLIASVIYVFVLFSSVTAIGIFLVELFESTVLIQIALFVYVKSFINSI